MLDRQRGRRGYRGPSRELSSEEVDHIDVLLSANRRLTAGFSGEFSASWLYSEWNATTWVTAQGNKTLRVSGVLVRTVDICWDIVLPDGKSLTDIKYAKLLETVKKIAFLFREGHHGGKPPAITTWNSFCRISLSIVRWMVLENNRFHVAEYGLSLLDQTGLNRLYAAMGKDGWTGALRLVERTLDQMYILAFGEHCPAKYFAEPTNLPLPIVTRIRAWLAENGGMGTRKHAGAVSRKFIATIIASPYESMPASSARLTSFLRQFEPSMASDQGLLLLATQSTEFPSHRTASIADAMVSSATASPVKRLNTTLSTILSLSSLLPDDLPDAGSLNLNRALSIGEQYSGPDGHTRFMPIDTGLAYLNESLKWVHRYGDAIVDYYVMVVARMRELNDGGTLENWEITTDELKSIPVPDALRSLGYQGESLRSAPEQMDFDELRSNPTLTNLLQVWAGAIVGLLACMKPPRVSELETLKRDCLLGSGPYYMISELAKRTYRDRRALTEGKPIPTIVARAIKQMQRLGDSLVEMLGEADEYKGSLLFYLPYATHTFGKTKDANSLMLNRLLDRFCDFVALPTDDFGRRWYVRVHEWRKWFLLLLFWSARFGALDAARDIAGHVDAEHLLAYLEREFPGVEFSSMEAEWAVDRLRTYDKTGVSVQAEHIDELHRKVLDHFKAKDLEMIPSQEWIGYVKQLRSDEQFHLKPYAIVDDFGNIFHVIAFQSFQYRVTT